MVKFQHHVHFVEPLRIVLEVTQKQDEQVAELEKQMDQWLKTLDRNLKKIEKVADQVK